MKKFIQRIFKIKATPIQWREELKKESPLFVCLVLIFILLFLPTGYEEAQNYRTSDHCRVEVLRVDNDSIIDTGLVRSGEQECKVKLLNGKFKGKTVWGTNQLQGSLESDKLFQVGDIALATVDYQGEDILYVNMVDHYRINVELILAGIFVLFLVLFAGRTGLRAVLSFVLTVLCIWKVLVPWCLNGNNPIYIGLMLTVFLIIVIISLVYGFDKRTAAATLGSILGVLVTCILGILFTDVFKIHGAVMSYSESLLYSGFAHLNLTQIFMASIFIGSSGAMMDLAVDITSAIYEVVANCPEISKKEAIKSGMNVGRAAMGTMTTTLLFAYSGGYIALLMVFMAQGTPTLHILNYKYVAAEILHTIVGSFGLVTVAPFTAIVAGILLTKKES
ncbi:YibE/F family protein [Clostridium sp. Marseille-P299]|uniref:YibE/F family protein n=1 Tax=Clostridium sp. Marseille-P299 TaxID=1805477 RepID=UPI0009EDC0CC|nr:YibE/F family protein [Clostridium sp. Marseille-P299]